MASKLYKLALWYIGKCNAKWDKCTYAKRLEALDRLTYWNFEKYLLTYGADAEWKNFSRYDVLDNAIQRLAKYETIGTIEEFASLKECFGHTTPKSRGKEAIDDFTKALLNSPFGDWNNTPCTEIKRIAVQMKGGK